MPEDDNPIAQALDLLVFAPLGLALIARDEFPRVVDKGRKRLTSQVAAARIIGRFAVAQGQRQAEQSAKKLAEHATEVIERLGHGWPPLVGSAPTPASSSDIFPPPGETIVGQRTSGSSSVGTEAEAATIAMVGSLPDPAEDRVAATAGVDGAALAIPGYDSLSASHVVQRLAGLSAAELADVAVYEQATRGRRTILSKIAQLQSGRT